MSLFDQNIHWDYPPDQLSAVIPQLVDQLLLRGYRVTHALQPDGSHLVSISRGGFWAGCIGMSTTLNLIFRSEGQGILMQTDVGLFRKQALPTAVTFLLFWPVAVTQTWGIIKQSRLDQEITDLCGSLFRQTEHAETTNNPL